MGTIIGFISDFGLDDTWVGVCHAVVHQLCPDSMMVDLSHNIPPYDIRKGAAVAASGAHQLPEAVHLVVVDPGVGGARRNVCVVSARGTVFVGPDNGVLLPAASRCGGATEAYALTAASGDLDVAPTFHARDILAPAAAAVACGRAPSDLGSRIEVSSLAAAPFGDCRQEAGYVVGEVLETDRFGSLRTNVPVERIDELGLRADQLIVEIGHNALSVPFRSTFADVGEGEPVMLLDSSGWLTLAINQGNAADRYGVSPGVHVRIRVP